MANETEQQQNDANQDQNTKQGKGYRRKGLVCEKVLLERLSDMSIEETVINPVITLSSVEGDDCESSPMGGCDSPRLRSKGTLKPSLSLDVPSLKLEDEAKRPPL
jgi:hypothetical protein